MKFIPKLLKIIKDKEDILKFINNDFYYNSSFYDKRLYIVYFKSCLKIFSISFIIVNHILDNILNIFDDKNFLCILLKILPKFYPILFNSHKEIIQEKIKKFKQIRDMEILIVYNILYIM